MLPFDVSQVRPESLLDGNRQQRDPILLALAPPNDNLMLVEVEIFHSKL